MAVSETVMAPEEFEVPEGFAYDVNRVGVDPDADEDDGWFLVDADENPFHIVEELPGGSEVPIVWELALLDVRVLGVQLWRGRVCVWAAFRAAEAIPSA